MNLLVSKERGIKSEIFPMLQGTDTISANNKYLEVSHLSCIRDDRVLINDLSFKLGAHQALLVEGVNGSGKTSLLRILCGIRHQESGQVYWGGTAIESLGAAYYQDLVYVGHLDGIKADLTVLENLRITQILVHADNGSADAILRQMDLLGYEGTPARALSAGQRRRLALARLVATKKTLWILDEPFTALDRKGISMIEEVLANHVASGGILVITSHHDVNLRGVDVIPLNLSA